jgi:hypothetical protein
MPNGAGALQQRQRKVTREIRCRTRHAVANLDSCDDLVAEKTGREALREEPCGKDAPLAFDEVAIEPEKVTLFENVTAPAGERRPDRLQEAMCARAWSRARRE